MWKSNFGRPRHRRDFHTAGPEEIPQTDFASRGGAAADPFGAPPAADTEVFQRRGNNAPAPVPAAAPMDRKGR